MPRVVANGSLPWSFVLSRTLLATVIGAWTTGAELEERNNEGQEFIFRTWQTDAGLPENTVHSLTQTPDGYIWCTTFNGLSRFDGVRFETFDAARNPEFPTSRLTLLGSSRTGNLVAFTELGQIVLRRNGRFSEWKLPRPYNAAHVIVEDQFGELWASDFPKEGPVWSGSDTNRSEPTGRLEAVLPPMGVLIDDEGRIVRLENQRLANFTSDRRWEPVDLPAEMAAFPIHSFWKGTQGLWLAGSGSLHLVKGKKLLRSYKLPDKAEVFTCLREDGRGHVWISIWHGQIFRLDLTTGLVQEITSFPGWKRTSTRTLLIDREGNVWVGLQSYGLLQIRPKLMRNYSSQNGLLSDIVRSVAEDAEGKIWIFSTGGINWLRNGKMEAPLSQNYFAWSGIPAGEGRMWVSTLSAGLHLHEGATSRKVSGDLQEKWVDPDFTFLFKDSKERIWFGNRSGLFQFDGTNFTAVPLPVGGEVDVRAAAEGKDGELFVGSNGRGLFVRATETGEWARIGRENGLTDEQVYCLHVDTRGILWIGTVGGGLARYDKKGLITFLEKAPELPRSVTGIQSDDLGFLWLGSTRGIFRVNALTLDKIAQGQSSEAVVYRYDRSAGLLSSECTAGIQPSVVKSKDGRIWFATTGGVVCWDPATIEVNPVPPPVLVESVSSSNSRIDLTGPPDAELERTGKGLRLAAGDRRTIIVEPGVDPIQFDFTALSFAVPENVRFQYRIEELEKSWNKTTARNAVYQRLPPGRYKFQVKACNNDGIWNETGAALAIVQLPFFWQTLWFKIALAGAAGLIFYSAHRYRLAQLERMSRLRARIAADLHDELGSNMGAIVLNSELLKASRTLADGEQEQLSDIHRIAQNTAQAIREIGWFINPDFDFLNEMIVRMKEFAERLLGKHQLEFIAPESVPKMRLSLEFRRNVMAIFKEALNNVVRHAEAKRVRIVVAVKNNELELTIEDDGCGFEKGTVNSGQGLRNLQRRSHEIEGILEITSSRQKGTKLCLKASMQ